MTAVASSRRNVDAVHVFITVPLLLFSIYISIFSTSSKTDCLESLDDLAACDSGNYSGLGVTPRSHQGMNVPLVHKCTCLVDTSAVSNGHYHVFCPVLSLHYFPDGVLGSGDANALDRDVGERSVAASPHPPLMQGCGGKVSGGLPTSPSHAGMWGKGQWWPPPVPHIPLWCRPRTRPSTSSIVRVG